MNIESIEETSYRIDPDEVLVLSEYPAHSRLSGGFFFVGGLIVLQIAMAVAFSWEATHVNHSTICAILVTALSLIAIGWIGMACAGRVDLLFVPGTKRFAVEHTRWFNQREKIEAYDCAEIAALKFTTARDRRGNTLYQLALELVSGRSVPVSDNWKRLRTDWEKQVETLERALSLRQLSGQQAGATTVLQSARRARAQVRLLNEFHHIADKQEQQGRAILIAVMAATGLGIAALYLGRLDGYVSDLQLITQTVSSHWQAWHMPELFQRDRVSLVWLVLVFMTIQSLYNLISVLLEQAPFSTDSPTDEHGLFKLIRIKWLHPALSVASNIVLLCYAVGCGW